MLWFLVINIYRDPAVATQILPLRFTVDNLKTQILCGIIERQIIGIPTDFLFLCKWQTLWSTFNWLGWRFWTEPTSLIKHTLKNYKGARTYWKHWCLKFTLIFTFSVNTCGVSLFWFHKQTWRIFCKIVLFLQVSKIVGDN